MSSTATQPARTHGQTGPEAAAWAERLRVANINPRTGLATDYLNHFNEAVMLLEMVPDMPECAEDFLTWTPLSYAEHFTASNFKARDLAIEAYEKADPALKAQFDHLTKNLHSILSAVGAGMREAQKDETRIKLAVQATQWVQPLISACAGLIHGSAEDDIDSIMAN